MKKINLASLCAALLLFLSPWSVLSCNDSEMLTQTGLQMVRKGASMSAEMEGTITMSNGGKVEEENDIEDLEIAYFVILALVVLIVAIGVAALSLFKKRDVVEPGYLAAGVIALILLQGVVGGFPLEKVAQERTAKVAEADKETASLVNIHEKKTKWFYLELIILLVPVGTFFYRKKKQG